MTLSKEQVKEAIGKREILGDREGLVLILSAILQVLEEIAANTGKP
jgi:hypothetical protein